MKRIIIVLLVSLGLMSLSPVKRTEYPIPPKTKKSLFYIQRNLNRNTIVYDANFDKNGFLDEENPVDVYWIRYEEQGQRMELRTVEKWYAYGVKCNKIEAKKNQYDVKLVADEDREFKLIQTAPYKAVIYTKINNKSSQLGHLYIFADNTGYWPKVKYIELFGKNAGTGKAVYEKINY